MVTDPHKCVMCHQRDQERRKKCCSVSLLLLTKETCPANRTGIACLHVTTKDSNMCLYWKHRVNLFGESMRTVVQVFGLEVARSLWNWIYHSFRLLGWQHWYLSWSHSFLFKITRLMAVRAIFEKGTRSTETSLSSESFAPLLPKHRKLPILHVSLSFFDTFNSGLIADLTCEMSHM